MWKVIAKHTAGRDDMVRTHISPPWFHVLLIWLSASGSHHSVDSAIARFVHWPASPNPEFRLSGCYCISMSDVGRANFKNKVALDVNLRRLAVKKCCLNTVISLVGMCYTLELIPRVSKKWSIFPSLGNSMCLHGREHNHLAPYCTRTLW